MKLPEHIWIGPLKFDVLVDIRPEENLLGNIKCAEQEIRLDPRIKKPQMIAATLWHEIVHGILDNLGHRDLSSDEDLVARLSMGVLQILLDNPELDTITRKARQ